MHLLPTYGLPGKLLCKNSHDFRSTKGGLYVTLPLPCESMAVVTNTQTVTATIPVVIIYPRLLPIRYRETHSVSLRLLLFGILLCTFL